jgi:Holliday junction resolvasome RuvABC endonuclease subunit
LERRLRVLGIDPAYGKKCAYAVANEHEDILSINGFDFKESLTEIESIHKNPVTGPIDVIALESNWLGINVATTQKLSEVKGWIWSAAQECGIPIENVHPASWQSKIPALDRMSGSQRRNWIISVAKSYFPFSINIDEACAIHIALYKIRRLKNVLHERL